MSTSSCDNIFSVQELTDYCLDFLHDSLPELKQCALVSRSWTKTSQLHIFYHIAIGSPKYSYGDATVSAAASRRCQLLSAVLSTSPRFLDLVRSMSIFLDSALRVDLSSFQTKFAFPHLRHISVSGNWTPLVLRPIHQLFGLGTLSSISISGNFSSLDEVAGVLSGCSPTIKKISFLSVQTHFVALQLLSDDDNLNNNKIEITSLDLCWSPGIHHWLNSPGCFFDFSNLQRLRLNENTSLPSWPAFASCIPRVEYLQFQPQPSANQTLDLAQFTHLRCIEMLIEFRDDIASALKTLTTIPHTNEIQTLRFRLTHANSIPNAETGSADMDRQLVALPLPCLKTVELVYITSPLTNIAENLPLLHARKLVRVLRRRRIFD
ncbi:hypothetical protein R3P38DRAFT_2857936 [Favolaschia claudopus]|uniref:F-box domain-containing protein n=1 Tax=Favolaschia claudopus TaxID=2862362 RepID=A0AAW0DGM6_9AGAR